MTFYVGVTDERWFRYLSALEPDEVNFWKPSGAVRFKAIPVGAPFLFKLRHPAHVIVGGGYFAGFSQIPVSMAWDAFGPKNGAPDMESLRASLSRIKKTGASFSGDPDIGCIALSEPFFFPPDEWIPGPLDWSKPIVSGKTYDTLTPQGATLWAEVATRLKEEVALPQPGVSRETTISSGSIYGNPYLAKARLGQGAFRVLTLENYDYRCCVTGESTVPVLEAAHIRPVSRDGDNALTNGLLLRADLHKLYDRGLIGVDPDYRVRISFKIRDLYLNGKVYYAHERQPLRSLPRDPRFQPSCEGLAWHMREVFVS